MRLQTSGAIFLLILVFEVCRSDDSACGLTKRCTCANFIMDCRSQELNVFPTDIPRDIKALYLNDNKIPEIKQIDEDPELQTLILTNNNIEKLTYDAFDNLDNLKTLRLSDNAITSIADDIFEWNPLKLEVLYLDGNKLEFIQHFLFYDLEELTDLYLQNNNITFIHPHAFLQLKNLRNLRLDGNKLHTFNPKWIEKLEANSFTALRFDGNPWSCDCAMNASRKWLKKDKSKWFRDLTNDNPIICDSPDDLQGKKLKLLSKTEVSMQIKKCDMPSITGISAATTIDGGRDVLLRCVPDPHKRPVPTISWTAPNKDIYRLNTAGNFEGITVHQDGSLLITNLTGSDDGTYTCNASNIRGYFTATTKITVNRVKEVDKSKKVKIVSAKAPDKNLTVQVHKTCPEECQCISRHIDCSGDGIKVNSVVPAGIPLDALTISLASNSIKEIGKSTFSKFLNLEELRLDDNDISEIDVNAFSKLKTLTTLTLQSNKLTKIDKGTFGNLEMLNVLVLDRNKLIELTKDMFEGLKKLQWLYVRHNAIKTISNDAFVDLLEIKFIHLESNDIQILCPQTVKTLLAMTVPKIKKIFVDDNNIQCDYRMEPMRTFIQDKSWQKADSGHEDLFGDGIICSYPPELADMQLSDIKDKLHPEDSTLGQPAEPSRYSGLLFGGIAVGVILTIVIIILWRKYGRSVRRAGKTRSYNYSNLNGNDESERSALTDTMGTSGSEAFV